jgi:arylsulfatase A-like enzyme
MRMSKRILSKRWPWLSAAALVVLAYLSTFVDLRLGRLDPRPAGSAADIEKLSERTDLNVLFILIDMLRADRLGSYGYARDTSPSLDRLASSGVRFARQLSQSSWTKCSMASLWTGMYPVRSGVTRFDHVTPPEAKLPAEILREAGYRTTALYRNGWVAPYFGFDQGFEVYDRPVSRPPPPSVRRENPTVLEGGSDVDALDAAVEFLRIHGRERWFLYLHLMDVHEYLYDEDTALFGSAYSDVYDNSIRRVSGILDDLLLHLAQQGYLENTLIAVASDHGEAFRERGLEGHARYVYRETTEVPFILSFPFRLESGVVVDVRTANVDIWPTLLDLLGLPALDGADGRSRVPEILAAARGEPLQDDEAPAFAELDRTWGQRLREPLPTVAVTQGSLRYVMNSLPQGQQQEELFDADNDAAELQNLLEERPEAAERLRALARSHLESPPAPWASEVRTLEMDEIQLDQLRALGYALP